MPDDCPISKVGLGIHHMAAIVDYDINDRTKVKDGRTFTWGRNHKGQLGIGTTDQQSYPVEVSKLHSQNMRLTDIQCGMSFTIGLSSKNKLIFVGDKRFCGKANQDKDILEVIELESIDDDISSISVCYNKILVKSRKGLVYHWGDYLQAEGKEISESKINPTKISDKSETLMKVIETGPNHSCAISFDDKLYCWGYDWLGSTGLKRTDEDQSIDKPLEINHPKIVSALNTDFQANEEKNRALNQGKKQTKNSKLNDKNRGVQAIAEGTEESLYDQSHLEESKGLDSDDEVSELLDDRLSERSAKSKRSTKIAMNSAHNVNSKTGKKFQTGKQDKVKAIDHNKIDYYEDIERPRRFIERSNMQTIYFNKAEKMHAIAKVLVDEKSNRCSEMDILKLNRKLNKFLEKIIQDIKSSKHLEEERLKYKLDIESSFISRVSYKPYRINEVYRDKNKIFGKVLNQNLNIIKNIMT